MVESHAESRREDENEGRASLEEFDASASRQMESVLLLEDEASRRSSLLPMFSDSADDNNF